MKLSHEKPPNWEKLVELFGAKWETTVVTYGDTVYSARPITPDLEVHEGVHIRQQAGDVEGWWKRYYEDVAFRLDQEIEAYQWQFEFMRQNNKCRNILFRFKDKIARDLSGPIYGNCISYEKAFNCLAKRPKFEGIVA